MGEIMNSQKGLKSGVRKQYYLLRMLDSRTPVYVCGMMGS